VLAASDVAFTPTSATGALLAHQGGETNTGEPGGGTGTGVVSESAANAPASVTVPRPDGSSTTVNCTVWVSDQQMAARVVGSLLSTPNAVICLRPANTGNPVSAPTLISPSGPGNTSASPSLSSPSAPPAGSAEFGSTPSYGSVSGTSGCQYNNNTINSGPGIDSKDLPDLGKLITELMRRCLDQRGDRASGGARNSQSTSSDRSGSASSSNSSPTDRGSRSLNTIPSSGASSSALGDATTDATGTVSGAASKILHGAPTQTVLHTTGYSFQDNQGGNNATISCGVIHKTAGGTGTYTDPITVAVPGHAGQGTQIPCGTEIYMPDYQRYFIVEDTGATDYTDAKHIDIYVGGEGSSADASQKCMDPVTTSDGSPRKATINPQPGLPVEPGPITGPDGKCEVPSGGGSASPG